MYYYATDFCIYMFHAFFVKHFELLKVLYKLPIIISSSNDEKHYSVVLRGCYKEVDLCS